MEKLWKSCGKAVEKLWKSCGKAVEKLWKSYGKALEKLLRSMRSWDDTQHYKHTAMSCQDLLVVTAEIYLLKKIES